MNTDLNNSFVILAFSQTVIVAIFRTKTFSLTKIKLLKNCTKKVVKPNLPQRLTFLFPCTFHRLFTTSLS